MFYLMVLLLLIFIATLNPVAALAAAFAIDLQVGLVMLCARLLLDRTPGFLPGFKGVVPSALALLIAGLFSGLIFARCLNINLMQALAVALLDVLASGLISWAVRDSIPMEHSLSTTTVLTSAFPRAPSAACSV